MVGAVAGTPGTLPTNWLFASAAGGLTREIVGVGSESGISYIDIRYFGTTTNAVGCLIAPGNGAALTGQTWAGSTYWKLVGGSSAGVSSFNIGLIEETSGGVFVTGAFYNQTAPTSAPLITQRPAASRTLSGGATVALLRHTIQIVIPTATAIDFTLRIGLPQLEQGAFATSVIPTSGTAVARSADVASITGANFSSWYRQDEGTIFTRFAQIAGGGRMAELSDGTSNNFIALFNINATVKASFNAIVSSVNAGRIDSGTALVPNVPISAAASISAGSRALSTDGALPVTASTPASTPIVNQMRIGADAAGGFVNNGPIRRLTYWPQRLPNSTLQNITL
jgi:hypothetical protein